MESFRRKWKEPQVNKLTGSLILIAGLISFAAGFGAWKNHHLDWAVFRQSQVDIWIGVSNEIVRFMGDPFAFIGLIIMITSSIAIVDGVKKLFFSSKKGR